jgi:hypothetical protein
MTDIRSELKGELFNYTNNFYSYKILEIGAGDGSFTTFFTTIIGNYDSFIHCVSPSGRIHLHFIYRLRIFHEKFKVRFFTVETKKFFQLYRYSLCKRYNLIYVNVKEYQNTEELSLFNDLKQAFHLLVENGILWINQLNNQDVQKYMSVSLGKFEIFHVGEEVGLKKIHF